MLDNVELVETLEETKAKALEVTDKLNLGIITGKEIEKHRDTYRPVARRGAILYFVLADMATINSMYQYSLAAYLEVFEFSLRKSLPDTNVEKRLRNILDTLTHNVYNYGCTGIFEKHKLLYSFQITLKLEMDLAKLRQEELDFFIKVCLLLFSAAGFLARRPSTYCLVLYPERVSRKIYHCTFQRKFLNNLFYPKNFYLFI